MKDLDKVLEGLLDADFDIGDEVIENQLLHDVLKNYDIYSRLIGGYSNLMNFGLLRTTTMELVRSAGEKGLLAVPNMQVERELKNGRAVMLIYNARPKEQYIIFLTMEQGRICVWPTVDDSISWAHSKQVFGSYKEFQEQIGSIDTQWPRLQRVAKGIVFGKGETISSIENKFKDLILR